VVSDQLGQLVIVVNLVDHKCLSVAEVQRADVIPNPSDHVLPLVLWLLFFGLPADLIHGFEVLAEQTGVVHQFLRNAADIHTSTTESPLGSGWRGLHEISKAYLAAITGGPFGCC
jgi:hypothetical protein